MKEVFKKDAYEKIKQGIAASKAEGEHPNLITGNKTSAVAVQKEKRLNKALEQQFEAEFLNPVKLQSESSEKGKRKNTEPNTDA